MPKYAEFQENLRFRYEKAEPVSAPLWVGYSVVLCVHEIVQNELFDAVADGVHTAGPFHLIAAFEVLGQWGPPRRASFPYDILRLRTPPKVRL